MPVWVFIALALGFEIFESEQNVEHGRALKRLGELWVYDMEQVGKSHRFIWQGLKSSNHLINALHAMSLVFPDQNHAIGNYGAVTWI